MTSSRFTRAVLVCMGLCAAILGAGTALAQQVPDVNDVYVSTRVERLGPQAADDDPARSIQFDFSWSGADPSSPLATGTVVQELAGAHPRFRIVYRQSADPAQPDFGVIGFDGTRYFTESLDDAGSKASPWLSSRSDLGTLSALVDAAVLGPWVDGERADAGWSSVPGEPGSRHRADPPSGAHLYATFDRSGYVRELTRIREESPGKTERSRLEIGNLKFAPPPPFSFRPRRNR